VCLGSGSGSLSWRASETAQDEEDDDSNDSKYTGDGEALSGGGTGGREAGTGGAGNGAACGLLFDVFGVGALICSPPSHSAAAKYTLHSMLTVLFAGQHTQCPCDSMSKPIQWPSHVCGSSLEPVGLCTHTTSHSRIQNLRIQPVFVLEHQPYFDLMHR
jgi:hypothetical protein